MSHRYKQERGVVYFLLEVDVLLVKIGFTTNLDQRLRQIQREHPRSNFSLLGTIDGTYGDEQSIHRKLADERHTGEWFEFRGVVRRDIAYITTEWR